MGCHPGNVEGSPEPFRVDLEAEAIVLDAGIGNRDKPDFLVTGGDVRHVDAEHFQPFFELFQGEVILVQHGDSPFG